MKGYLRVAFLCLEATLESNQEDVPVLAVRDGFNVVYIVKRDEVLAMA